MSGEGLGLWQSVRRPNWVVQGLFCIEDSVAPARFHTWVDNDHESKNKLFSRTWVPRQQGRSCMSSFFTLTQLYQGQPLHWETRTHRFFLEATQQQLCSNVAPTVSCIRQFNKSSIKIWCPLIEQSGSLLWGWWERKEHWELCSVVYMRPTRYRANLWNWSNGLCFKPCGLQAGLYCLCPEMYYSMLGIIMRSDWRTIYDLLFNSNL